MTVAAVVDLSVPWQKKITWSNLGPSDDGDWQDVSGYEEVVCHIDGTNKVSTLTVQGSLEDSPTAANAATVLDRAGNSIASNVNFLGATMGNPRFIRPITGAGVGNDEELIVICRRYP